MPLPPPGKYRLYLFPFPIGAPITVNVPVPPTGPTATFAGVTAQYEPVGDSFPFAPNVGISCDAGGHWTATVPDKNGNPVDLRGYCLPEPP